MCVTICILRTRDLPIAAQPAPAIKENAGLKPLGAQVFYMMSIQKEFLPPPFVLIFCYMIL